MKCSRPGLYNADPSERLAQHKILMQESEAKLGKSSFGISATPLRCGNQVGLLPYRAEGSYIIHGSVWRRYNWLKIIQDSAKSIVICILMQWDANMFVAEDR
jgi:hypothetical protein